MADEYQAGIILDVLRMQLQIVLRNDIEFETGAFGPVHEMALIRGPTGRSVFFRIAVGPGVLHVRIGHRFVRTRRRRQCRARRILRQHDKSARQRALGRQDRRIGIASRSANALVVIRAAPVVVGAPGAGRRYQQQSILAVRLGATQDKQESAVRSHPRWHRCAGDPVTARTPGHRDLPSSSATGQPQPISDASCGVSCNDVPEDRVARTRFPGAGCRG